MNWFLILDTCIIDHFDTYSEAYFARLEYNKTMNTHLIILSANERKEQIGSIVRASIKAIVK